MSRSAIGGFQKQSGSLIPEFDYDVTSQAAVDAWNAGNSDVTSTIIPYSQFQSETGYTGGNPLSNLNQENVLKCTVNTVNTGYIHFALDIALAASIDISRGICGMYIWYDEATQTLLGGAGDPLKAWFETGSITDYRNFGLPTDNPSSASDWSLVGGLDDDDYDLAQVGASYDATAIDKIRLSIDTDGNDVTFYLSSAFYNAKRRPVIMIEQDDINDDTTELFDDLDAAGLKGAVNGIYGNMGGTDNATQAQMKDILDRGHFVYLHGTDGLRTDLAVDSDLFIAQWESEHALWSAFYPAVLDDTTLKHGALPLGETDDTTRKWMIANGYKTMRRTGGNLNQGLISQPAYGNTQYMHIPAYAIGPQTETALKALIDISILHGLDICLYLHQYITTSGNRAAVQALFAYIKFRQDQGLLECLPRHLWYDRSIAQYGKRSAI